MPKISDEELVKVLVRLWKKDYDAIQRMATTEVTAAQIIREAVSHFVRAAEDRARRTIDANAKLPDNNPWLET